MVSFFFRPKPVSFRCNICGADCRVRLSKLTRESATCARCGSWPRIRSIVHVLSVELFGTSLALPDFPVRRDLAGIGLSDWRGLRPLADKFDYTNTTFDGEGDGVQLDVCNAGPEWDERLDFIISTEVFEHVVPPVSRAFEGAYRMLKPGGVLVLSVPYIPDGTTIEHFPELHDFHIADERGTKVLHNVTADGRTQRFDQLVFHGGEGATLEMRQFARASLLDDCVRAGFRDIRFDEVDHMEHGVYWPEAFSRPLSARK